MSMVLRHATVAKYLGSIRKGGLQGSKSQGARKVIWLHSRSRSWWAAKHVLERHGGGIQDVRIVEVKVPRSWLRRSQQRGLWYCTKDIGPERFREMVAFSELVTFGVVVTERRGA